MISDKLYMMYKKNLRALNEKKVIVFYINFYHHCTHRMFYDKKMLNSKCKSVTPMELKVIEDTEMISEGRI